MNFNDVSYPYNSLRSPAEVYRRYILRLMIEDDMSIVYCFKSCRPYRGKIDEVGLKIIPCNA